MTRRNLPFEALEAEVARMAKWYEDNQDMVIAEGNAGRRRIVAGADPDLVNAAYERRTNWKNLGAPLRLGVPKS